MSKADFWVIYNTAYPQDGESQYSIAFPTEEAAREWLMTKAFIDCPNADYYASMDWDNEPTPVEFGQVF